MLKRGKRYQPPRSRFVKYENLETECERQKIVWSDRFIRGPTRPPAAAAPATRS